MPAVELKSKYEHSLQACTKLMNQIIKESENKDLKIERQRDEIESIK